MIDATTHLVSDGLGPLLGYTAAVVFFSSPFVAAYCSIRFVWRKIRP